MADPPLDPGAVHRAVASIVPPMIPDEALPMAGVPGTVAGVTAVEKAE